ncbi:MAG: M48 family metalloprotease [Deltaproteobacteria bacterium]|nr:M48 family metalloprotease [Deltaproteobacteria bacterium]
MKLLLSAIFLFITACSSTPQVKPLTIAEKIQKDYKYGFFLIQRFEAQLKLKQDIEVSIYLRTLTETLIKLTNNLKNTPFGTVIIKDTQEKWNNYALPGSRIYLSLGLLKQLNYETELASILSYEIAQLEQKLVLNQIEKQFPGTNSTTDEEAKFSALPVQEDSYEKINQLDFFSPRGIFIFSEEELVNSVETAVSILYQAGFDVRGLVSLWKIFLNNPKTSPYEQKTLNKLIEKTRQTLATYTPLLNPKVKSNKFLAFKKRIQNI